MRAAIKYKDLKYCEKKVVLAHKTTSHGYKIDNKIAASQVKLTNAQKGQHTIFHAEYSHT